MKRTKYLVQTIKQEYEAGASMTQLAKKYRLSTGTIHGWLHYSHALVRNSVEVTRKYTCEHHYFDYIQSEKQAYWLGFLGADGYVHYGNQTVRLSLNVKDYDHLVAFNADLGSDNPIRTVTYQSQTSCRCQICSVPMVTALKMYGIVPGKTANLPWPTLPDKLIPHYVRGYFDGDGCFSIDKRYAAKHIQFIVTSNLTFLEHLQAYLNDHLPRLKGCLRKTHRSDIAYMLRYWGNRQVTEIARFMYTDATRYLPRKKALVDHLL